MVALTETKTETSDDEVAEASARLTVIIPAYNEENGLPPTLEALLAEPRLKHAQILVVDDGSTDKTAEAARGFERVTVLQHKNNQGYGAGIKTGAWKSKTEYVAWFDADGQHRPEDLAMMFQSALDEQYDAVIGIRQQGSNVVKSRVAGKWVLKRAARFVSNVRVDDINCGLRVFRRDLLIAYLPLLPNGFSASTTSLLVFLRRNRHVGFHPVITEARVGKSSVRQIRDGFATLHLMMRILFLFSAFKVFSMLAAIFVVIGGAYGLGWAIYSGKGFPVLGAMIITSGILLFAIGIISDQISSLRLDLLERGPRGDWTQRTR